MQSRIGVFALSLLLAWALAGVGASVAGQRQPANLSVLKKEIIEYYDSGRWSKDVAQQCDAARRWLKRCRPSSRTPAAVLDIDDTVLDNYAFLKSIDFARSAQPWTLHFLSAEAPAVPHMRELLLELRKRGYRIFFITGRWERFRDATAENLRKVGIERYERIIMLPDGKKVSSMIPFKSSSRRALIREGCDIILNIGDQESDLAGGYSRKCIKLPNPMYYTP